MRKNVPDVHDLPTILDDCDEPVFVATDVEHGEHSDQIRVREVLMHIREIFPLGASRHQVLMHQGFQGGLV